MISATPHLTPAELFDALSRLEIEQQELARLLDAGPATVRRWMAGTTEVPGHVSLLMRLMLERPELRELLGVRPRSGRGRPLKLAAEAQEAAEPVVEAYLAGSRPAD